MKARQWSFTVAALAVAVMGHASAASLEQTVAGTLDTHPDLRIVFSRYKAYQEQMRQAKSGYLPQVDLSAGYGYEKSDSPSVRALTGGHDRSLHRGEATISLRQMLFDGFRVSSEVDRLSNEAKAEQYQLLSSAENTALKVSKVYLDVIRQKAILELANRNLESHQKIFDSIRQRTESGVGTSSDLSQIAGRLARAQANVMAAQNNYDDAVANYIREVNAQPENLVIPVPDADMLPKTLDEGLEMAKTKHPLLESSQYDVSAAQAERRGAKSNYYPNFYLEVSQSDNNNLDGFKGYNNQFQAMVRMRYNLFAGGHDSARVRETTYKLGEAKEIQQRTWREVAEGLRLSWNAYQSLDKQMSYIRRHVEASKETQVAYAKQFDLGKRTLLDLLDTENELFEARRDYLNAEFDETYARYRVLNAEGLLLDSLRVTRPPIWHGEE
ncbi:TolC family outer membrane protein [Gallaecimonas kandeliae]|uniref:TolC family outer membrane protein n=1 Tax=Gallaecimonas kandeliae TaxID=3029055 RepID=UPI002648F403|nr:TolC family outer membrane protein [Gallaecimonas kandeliae]WKE65126.1 TolC family outer membrane protein [Gallaecimonas kandeliae]